MNTYSEREARLVPTLINVLIAGMCDPTRLQRGRTYSRQGAVMDVHVDSGELVGFVQGGRPTPYEVVIHVSTASDFGNLTALVPTGRDVRFDCSCPDWESPCKHAVAVMAAFAERVGSDPQLLATWRGAPAGGANSGPRAVVGSRSARPSRGDSTPAPPPITPDVHAAVDEFLGVAPVAAPADESAHEFDLATLPVAQSDGWDEPWAAMLESAIRHLRDAVSNPNTSR